MVFTSAIAVAFPSPITIQTTLQPSTSFKPLITTALRALQSKDSAFSQVSELPDISWDNVGFNNPMTTDYMYIIKCTEDGDFRDGGLQRFGNIEFNPAACVLNYGQGLVEELKAYKKLDNSIVLFRPDEYGLRMRMGAERMCMPAPTIEQFTDAVKLTVLANRRWVPPPNKGFLQIKPVLMGNGPVLAVKPAPEFTFLVYATSMGNKFKEKSGPVNLVVENKIHRAVPGGAGGVNAIGNYAPVLKALVEAKANGFCDVIYLDSVHDKYVEQTSTANIFLVKDKIISTPTLDGTVLPGVTRKSIIDIAHSQGCTVEERRVSIEELLEADEVFCTRNAVGLSTVGSITYKGKRVCYKETGLGGVSEQLFEALSNIQKGLLEEDSRVGCALNRSNLVYYFIRIELSSAAGVLNYGQVPPRGKGSLYIRPLLIGSGPVLGLAPSPECTFLAYASLVRNIFIVKGNVISTPATNGTILLGITRRSIIEIAHDHGYKVEERAIPVDELSEADEVFCTGTAVGVAPVGNITYKDQRMEYKTGDQTVCSLLYRNPNGSN